MFFKNNSIYPIGLDISDSSLKLIQLDKIRDKIKIQAIGRADLKVGLFDKGEVVNKEEVIKAIKELVDNPLYGGVSSNEVVACLPETKTFIKLIEVERTPNNLELMIEAEIEKHVPLAIDEIYYDWQIVKKFRDKYHVLIGAAPKKIVDQYTALLTEAGLSVIALEIEPIAICRSMLREEHINFKDAFEKNYIIMDFGAVRTSLTLYSKNTILFTVTVPVSGEDITQKIAKALEIDIAQAEKAKVICGLDENKAQGVVKNILANVTSELTQKINEAIGFFEHHFPDRGPINEIILCGGGANIKNLPTVINDTIKVNANIGNALINLNEIKEDFYKILTKARDNKSKNKKLKIKPKEIEIDRDINSTFATSIGLALRNLFLDK